MKTKTYLITLLIIIYFQSCNAQQAQTALPQVENNLNGPLDYTHETLILVQKQPNGKEISLGKITTDGTIHFNMPNFDIKALYDSINLQHHNFHQLFKISSDCKDRDVFEETPFDNVYSQKTNAIFIKKYGINVAVLEPKSDKKMSSNNDSTKDSVADSNNYFWFYIDRAIPYKEKCDKTNSRTGAVYANISTDIQFEKGWNFIEENLISVQYNNQDDSQAIQPSKIHFTKISPENKKVKWTLRQIAKDEKIQTAKKLHSLTPLTKEQFEKWAPNKLDDLSITTKEYGNPPKRFKNKNNLHLIYTNKSQQKEIELYVVDCAKSPDDMNMINFAYAMENKDKSDKDIKPYVTQYNEKEKATNLLYKVEDRIFVTASAGNINGEELWKYIQKLNVEKLLKDQ
ncbi:hypothetical protein JBL43_07030 [Aureibaculum sp. A20]|uniref:DUF4367 domain-containing protein n=1 Tax=Aureibaculum flavum TaxID=2795986 RepID=A0ABS0WPR9_9FLAO|nr:hypothetical protein [Aureibaculum flavum]MBJ2173984.1 hypothetical protein [Aureibaculum flavum]